MTKPSHDDVPDTILPYLNEIAERLWAGRAAVMIGAGFSKNAGPGFPDWNELGDLFYEKAHGTKPEAGEQKYLDVLRLAEEVQANIGRPALENLLRSRIPDLTVEPSDLHEKLLELPWDDVFTTNYDTLLERASAKVVMRRYEPVVNKEDLPYALKPRIVKLHGSFPSQRPFIVTEEDYRRYPYDYAPFVNTVQQSLLENTFCLIGFSGDDPNFLTWIGWIRDNLGRDKTQKIYLVGLFDLMPARLQLLATRDIVVVDLSSFSGIDRHDHRNALLKFFECMQAKEPRINEWPFDSNSTRPDGDKDRNDEITKIVDEWRCARHSYPGWLILPYENREKLWGRTQDWVHYLPDIDNSPAGMDILYAFELIWRLERCLFPIFSHLVEFCERVLQKYWPFYSEPEKTNYRYRVGGEQFNDLPWKDLRQAWLVIALAMLRFYREEGLLVKWKNIEALLASQIGDLAAAQRETLEYERYLFSLFILDLPMAKQRLANWQPSVAVPYWIVKRAAALAELGMMDEAEALAEEALNSIRRKLDQKVGMVDCTLQSLESYAMLVGECIRDAALLAKGEWSAKDKEKAQSKKRWNELKSAKCDPWNELKLLELSLAGAPASKKALTEKPDFDIGHVTRSYRFAGTNYERLNAFAFLRFCEDIGLPFRVGNSAVAKRAALASLDRISRESPFWATATLVRVGDTKGVDSLLSRESIHKLSTDEADERIRRYLDALEKSRDEIHVGHFFHNNNFGLRLAQLLPEVMSRLCSRCSVEMKLRMLESITDLYASPDKAKYRHVGIWLKRLIRSMSAIEQYHLIPELLRIPYPTGVDSRSEDEFPNPLWLTEVQQKPANAPDSDIERPSIDSLLRQAASDDSDLRRWSTISLESLDKLGLLNEQQRIEFGRILWRTTDDEGFPANTAFYKFAFLRLPHPEDVDPMSRFKSYVRGASFSVQGNRDGVSWTGGNVPLVTEIVRAAHTVNDIWTEKDVVEILIKALDWWDVDKARLAPKERESPISLFKQEDIRSRFKRLIDLIVEVVAPRLTTGLSDDVKSRLDQLLNEVREYNLPCLEAEAACLHIVPERKTGLVERVNDALNSNDDEIARDGLWAVAKLILDDSNDQVDSVVHEAASLLDQYLTWRPTHSVGMALGVVFRILKDRPAEFSQHLEEATLRRLRRLLTETAYTNEALEIEFAEKLDVRRTASKLAAALWTHYRTRDLPVPKVVEDWRSECLSPDEFPEIRNAWEGCTDE